MECTICTNICKKTIKCPYCATDNIICKDCVTKNVLINVASPTCIFCRALWTVTDISTLISHKFVASEVRSAETHLLLAREDGLVNKSAATSGKMKTLVDDIKQLDLDIKKLKNLIEEKRTIKKGLKIQIKRLNHESFHHPCPIAKCSGFIHVTDNYCNVCGANVCSKCLEVLNGGSKGKSPNIENIGSSKGKSPNIDGHLCSEANLKTLQLLAEAKRCPNCQVSIQKVEGCSQMFCTMCYTAFDWNTLEIIKGHIHNPHYQEILKGVSCGNFRELKNRTIPLSDLVSDLISYDQNIYITIKAMHEIISNNQLKLIVEALRNPKGRSIEDLRYKYSTGDIDRKIFGDKLYILERKRNINLLLLQSLEILNDIIINCLLKLSGRLNRCLSVLSVKDIDNLRAAKRLLNNTDREVIHEYKKKILEVLKTANTTIIEVYEKMKSEYSSRGVKLSVKKDIFKLYLDNQAVTAMEEDS